MNQYVVDTSVACAWYLDEVFSASARVWQDKMLSGRIVLLAPALHFWEFANVLRTLVHRRELSRDLAQEIYDLHLEAPHHWAQRAMTNGNPAETTFSVSAHNAMPV